MSIGHLYVFLGEVSGQINFKHHTFYVVPLYMTGVLVLHLTHTENWQRPNWSLAYLIK